MVQFRRAKVLTLSGTRTVLEIMPDKPCRLNFFVDGKPKGMLTFENVMQQTILEVCPGGTMRLFVDEKVKE